MKRITSPTMINRCLQGMLLLMFFAGSVLLAAPPQDKLKKGVKAFQGEQWDEALNYFQDALVDEPENPLVHYNVGTALYKKERYEDALASFEKSLQTEDISLQQQTYYNRGNVLYRLEKYQEAVEAYKKALDIQPEDMAAKHNLELVRAKLKEMADKQQQQQQDQEDQEQIEPSEYAKQLKAQAEILVGQKLYNEALNLMMRGLQTDETVAAFQDFIQRIKDIVDIEEAI